MAKRLDPTTKRAVAALIQASTLLDPFRLKEWDDKQLTVTQLRLLSLLDEEEGVGNSELADKLRVTRPSVSALLDRLERGGFLRREISLSDRRGIRIWLEPAGREAVTRIDGKTAEHVSDVLDELGDDERLALAHAFERVVENATSRRVRDHASQAAG